MEVLILLIFISLIMVAAAVGFFAWNIKLGNHNHAMRLSLLPLNEDSAPQSEHENNRRRKP